MADFFGAIAAAKQTGARLPLISPKPLPKNNTKLQMAALSSAPTKVYKKPDSKTELDAAIARLGEAFAPFRKKVSPDVINARTRIDLDEFDFRLANENDLRNFQDVVIGKGEWKKVSVPHYDGPVGKHTAYYRKEIEINVPENGKRAFLHFDGADYISEIFINGAFVGSHEGFFGAFEFDITPYIKNGKNILLVVLKNDFIFMGNATPSDKETRIEGDKLYAATGPGYDDPEWGWHHCPPGMGIYQKVYLEIRPEIFISDIFVRPMIDSDEFEVWTTVFSSLTAPQKDFSLSYSVYGYNFSETVVENYKYIPITYPAYQDGYTIDEETVAKSPNGEPPAKLCLFHGENTIRFRFKKPNMKLWTPSEPYLYEAQVKLTVGKNEAETRSGRFGMRSFVIDTADEIKGMPYLNGSPCRLRGANTMGYEQQDVMHKNNDQLLYDMLMAKACNMNFLRLTQRPVQYEIYDLCDEIGLMIQTDLPLFAAMRRTKFAEGVRQAEEMERLIRSHPCCILVSYMNEPSKNANNAPHRHLARHELEGFFRACDEAVHVLNPDRAIKYIDGDYDPPSSTLPDNHCYCTWYNGHGIDLGKLHRGYWLDVKDGWYYACGEFGAEGLDTVDLMRRRYPKEWLPQTAEEEKTWSPGNIVNAQSGNMHFFYYDTQETLEDWVKESWRHQVIGTELQTAAFRRDPRMVSFAIHLFIDAFPSGWLKTIVNCEREPKPAFFKYQDLLTPLMVDLRTDRTKFFENETVNIEAFVCNDTSLSSKEYSLTYELIKDDVAIMRGKSSADIRANTPLMQGEITFIAPAVSKREKFTLRLILSDESGNVVHYTDREIEIFKFEDIKEPSAIVLSGWNGNENKALSALDSGKTVVIEDLEPGEYDILGSKITVKSCGMRPLHFVSRKTGHPLVKDFAPDDIKFWYNEEQDMMTPIVSRTFVSDDMTPVLTSGNCKRGSAWGQKLSKVFVTAEKTVGNGKLVINMLDVRSHLKEPTAVRFYNRLYNFK